MRKWILCLSLVVAATNMLIAQDRPDSRVMSNAYWKEMIERGLAAPANIEPAEPATYLGSRIDSRLVLGDDSPDVLTSPGGNTIQTENSVIVHPLDNQRVFNANNSTDGSGNVFYTTSAWKSSDGGLTWAGTVNLPGAGSDLGDPATGIDLNGRYYVGHINGFNFGQSVAWSTDGGNNWTNSTIVASGTEDKNHLWVDVVPTSPYEGNVYSAWTAFSSTSGIVVSRSTNSGVNWTSPLYISGAAHGGSHDQGVSLQTGPNGEVYAAWAIYDSWPSNETAIGFARSTDGGATWLPATRIIQNINGIRQDGAGGTPGNVYPVRTNSFPVMTVDISGGGNHGRIYIAWVNHGTPGVNTENDRSVWMSYSDNQGASWSSPVKVNQDAFGAGKERFNSWIACDPVTGSLAAIFYDNRNTTGNVYETWVATSIDGGTTWEDFRVSDVSFTPAQPPGSYAFGYFGDYLAISARGGFVYPVWSDNRSGLPLSYTSPFQLAANVGWVEGIVTSGGNPLDGVTVDFVEGTIQIPGTSDPTGYYLAGAEVDTLTGTQDYTIRATKFGYLEYTAPITLLLGDTITHDISMATAAGGTLAVHAETNDGSGIGADVSVLLNGEIVVTGMTDPGTGNYSTALPVGTYDVIIDPPSPYGTETFTDVVINDGATTNVDALIQYVLDPNPTEVRDTLTVGQLHAKTLVLTNTTDDPVPFFISDDAALLRKTQLSAPKPLSQKTYTALSLPKGAKDPRPGIPPTEGSGGPDAFGYEWIDSDEPGGPTFDWVDISSTGTLVNESSPWISTGTFDGYDEGYLEVPLPFPFSFYGSTYNSVYLGSNGMVLFQPPTGDFYVNQIIPTPGDVTDNFIAALWQDLWILTPGRIYYGMDGSDFVIQWVDIPVYFSSVPDYTFEYIFKPNGQVIVQYLDLGISGGSLTSASVGQENQDGTVGLNVVFNATYLHDNLAIRYFLPDAPWISENPTSGTIPANSSQDITVSFDATGLTVGTTYSANIFVDADHPDVTEDIVVPATLTVEVADSATLIVSSVYVEFPVTPVNETRRDSITARNGGGTVLNISSITSTNGEFVVSPNSAILNPLDSIQVYIDYTPTAEGADTGRVIMLSNSQGTPRLDVILAGTAIGVPQFIVQIDSLQIDIEGGVVDSLQFQMRNVGTASGDFQARAILVPQGASPDQLAKPIIVPLTLKPASTGGVRRAAVGSDRQGTRKTEVTVSPSLYQNAEVAPILRGGTNPPSPFMDPFDLQFSFDLNIASGAAGNAGAEFDGTYYYSTRWASNLIHKYDLTGTLVDEFSIPGVTGLRDLTYDGTFMYGGAAANTIYQMDFDNQTLIGTISSPVAVRHIAYDRSADAFWVGTWDTDLVLVNRSGQEIDRITNFGLVGQYGTAYDDWTTGGPFLWVFDQGSGAGLSQFIYQVEIATGTPTGVMYDVAADFPASAGIAGGLWAGEGVVAGKASIGGVLQGVPDVFFVYELADAGAQWLTIIPSSGTLGINQTILMTARFDATSPEIYENPGSYYGTVEVTATNSTLEDTLLIPVRMYVIPPAGARLIATPASLDFGEVAIGGTVTASTLVKNIGLTTLNVTNISTDNGAFAVVPPTSFSLATNDTHTVQVTFTGPMPAGTHTGNMTFTSNDPLAPVIPMTGVSFGVPHFADRIDSLQVDIEAGLVDSIQFYMRNDGTEDGTFNARATVFPPPSADGLQGKPISIPVTIVPAKRGRLTEGAQISSIGMATAKPAVAKPKASPAKAKGISNKRIPSSVLAGGSLAQRNPSPVPVDTRPIINKEGVGDIILSWPAPAGIVLPWGLGWNFDAGNLLVSDPLGPPIEDHYVSETGTLLQSIPTSAWHGSWPGDADYNGGYFYQVAVGGTNGIYKLDIAGNVIEFMTDPAGGWSSISQRGLAYDPGENVFYVGGWNQNIIYKVKGFGSDNPGEVILQYPFLNVSGLAFHTGSQTLWVADNSASDMIFEVDPNTGQILQQFPAPGLIGFAGAGLSIHADGNLWCVNQTEVTVYLIETGVPLGANWLSIAPTEGTVAVGDSVLMTARFDATDPSIAENPGNYYGQVTITATDPEADTLLIPARMYVIPPPGARLTVTPQSLDFGNVEIGASEMMSVLVKNIGQTTLDVTNISIDDPNYAVVPPTSFSLATFDTHRVFVTFTAPEPAGTYDATMSFTSNDPMAPTVPLTAVAEGVAHIAVNPDSFYFNLTSTDTVTSTMTLHNTGTGELDFEIVESLAGASAASIEAAKERSQRQQAVPEAVEKGKSSGQPGQPPVDGMGGPDEYGYVWIDSDEPGGPTFEWDDITGVGSQLFMFDDDNQGPFNLGFTFNFYGNSYSAIRICSNGFVSFTSTFATFTNTAIPTVDEPNNAIYGFWDDLNPSVGGTIHYYSDVANGRFVVQYTDVPHYGSGGPYTFQVIVKSNGEILTQYLAINTPDNSCTIGIENSDGSIALQTVFDATYVHDNLAILFTRDAVPWMSAEPTMGSVAAGDSTEIEVRVHPEDLANGSYSGAFVISGNTPDVAVVPVTMDLLTGVESEQLIPTVYALSQNYPNPFNPETRIKYSIPEQATVSLKVYNLLGQEVVSLTSGVQDAGYYEIAWDGHNSKGVSVGTGVYFYRFEATGVSGRKFSDLKKMLFLK